MLIELCIGLGFERAQEHARVDHVEALGQSCAAGPHVQRCGDRRSRRHVAGIGALFAQVAQQRVAAQRDADDKELAALRMANRPIQAFEDPRDLGAVAAVVHARREVHLARAPAKVRNDAQPAAAAQRVHQQPRVVAARITLQTVEHNDERRVRVGLVRGPVQVDEVVVGCVPTFAPIRNPRKAPQARGHDRLRIAADQPPRRTERVWLERPCKQGVQIEFKGGGVARRIGHRKRRRPRPAQQLSAESA